MAVAVAKVGAMALGKSAPTLVQLLLGAIDKMGVADIVRQSLKEVQQECRSITVTIKNESTRDLIVHSWYAHRGQHEGTLPRVIEAKSTATIKFVKAKNNFFGVSGYIDLIYHEEMKTSKEWKFGKLSREEITYGMKKRVIISFAVPRIQRINKLIVALLDEGKFKWNKIPNEIDMYVYLKSEGNRKKMAAVATSGVKGHCQHPSIHDHIIDVDCQISGDEHAILDVAVTDSKTLQT